MGCAALRAQRGKIKLRWHWDPGMTLAVIFLLSLFCTTSAGSLPAARSQSAAQPAAPSTPAEPQAGHDQATAPSTQNPSTPAQPPASTQTPAALPAPASSGQARPATVKKPRHKKRVPQPDCNSATATASGATDSVSSGNKTSDPPAKGTVSPGTSSAPSNCPPPKVIVRQGGASEPSIQLAGGAAGDQTSHTRDTANQMLGSTEANLKKIAGRQLSPNQQDMVNQIRQFIEQSKTAVASGDLERAHTLAWKAQLLSEELVKPEK